MLLVLPLLTFNEMDNSFTLFSIVKVNWDWGGYCVFHWRKKGHMVWVWNNMILLWLVHINRHGEKENVVLQVWVANLVQMLKVFFQSTWTCPLTLISVCMPSLFKSKDELKNVNGKTLCLHELITSSPF